MLGNERGYYFWKGGDCNGKSIPQFDWRRKRSSPRQESDCGVEKKFGDQD